MVNRYDAETVFARSGTRYPGNGAKGYWFRGILVKRYGVPWYFDEAVRGFTVK